MSTVPVFWDASALVPLCIHEMTSRQAQSHLRKSMPVVWWASRVEVHSAIARLNRFGKLNDPQRKGALSRLEVLSRGWREILPSDPVRDLVTHLLGSYDLRAADGFQLAAALVWCQERPVRRTFICVDQRLSKAAAAAGFSVVELS